LLAAMGVQVWYERPRVKLEDAAYVSPDAEQATAAAVPAEAPASEVGPIPEPLAFSWIKSERGMVVCPLGADGATARLVKDVLVFGDWVRGHGASHVAQGDFRWPQLLDSGGTPERALAVFLDKHLSAPSSWLGLTAEVAPSIAPWLNDLHVEVLELPLLRNHIGDAATKKSIWQRLKQDN